MPKARSASVSDITAGINIRCNESELPNGLAGSDAAVSPVLAILPIRIGAASANGKFCV